LDINDGAGLGELTRQANVLSRELIQASRLGQCRVGLASSFLWFKRRSLDGSALLAPGG
jgi:hypothetical protein